METFYIYMTKKWLDSGWMWMKTVYILFCFTTKKISNIHMDDVFKYVCTPRAIFWLPQTAVCLIWLWCKVYFSSHLCTESPEPLGNSCLSAYYFETSILSWESKIQMRNLRQEGNINERRVCLHQTVMWWRPREGKQMILNTEHNGSTSCHIFNSKLWQTA